MKYMGSKNRIARHILPIMLEQAKKSGITTWVEPFVGGGNMIDKVPPSFKRIGIDSNPHAIEALTAIRDLVHKLPDRLSEAEYRAIIGSAHASPIISWLRFVASFGGKLDNGYAREAGSDESTFVGYGKRNAQKQSPRLQDVELISGDYQKCNHMTRCIIYCDPPYAGTTSYKTDKFDHDKFWNWCYMMAQHNLVFISEYAAPNDFQCIWEGEIKTNFASKRSAATRTATEKLFTIKR